MAIKLTLLSVDAPGPGKPTIDAIILVTLTGSYPALGEVVNFPSLAGQFSQEGGVIDADLLNQVPVEAYAESQTGGWGASGGGYYSVSTYTNVSSGVATKLTGATCKFRAWAAGGTEESTGAYDATIIGDQIVMRCRWQRER